MLNVFKEELENGNTTQYRRVRKACEKNTLKQHNLVRPSPFHALNNNPMSLIFNSPETHNWGTESDPGFKYHNGNSEPRGFEDDYPKQEVIFISGNIGVTVDDTYKAFESL
ncbi:hypothetical protein Peur_051794 [Populus x canadensis]